MNNSVFESVNPGTATATHSVANSVSLRAMPSYVSLARSTIDRMMKDEDVALLPEEVRTRTQKFSVAVASAFPSSQTSSIGVFGDPEDGVGSIVFLDRDTARQIEFTVSNEGTEVWMRGPLDKKSFSRVTLEQVPLLWAIFSRLD